MRGNGESIKAVVFPNKTFFEQVRKLTESGQSVTITVLGNSMQPFFESRRDEIKVTGCETVCVNDVVVALTNDNRYVAHRVVAVSGENITLMGDGNVNSKEFTVKKNVVGRVVAYRKKGNTEYKPLYSMKWRIYSAFWNNTLSARRYLLAFYRRLSGFADKNRHSAST